MGMEQKNDAKPYLHGIRVAEHLLNPLEKEPAHQAGSRSRQKRSYGALGCYLLRNTYPGSGAPKPEQA